MFSTEDLRIESIEDLIEFLPIVVFIVFIAPFLGLAYTIGFLMDKAGYLD